MGNGTTSHNTVTKIGAARAWHRLRQCPVGPLCGPIARFASQNATEPRPYGTTGCVAPHFPADSARLARKFFKTSLFDMK
jgi:hypothetical protein